MARRTIIVSDLTGKEINDRDSAQLIINYSDAAAAASCWT